MKAVIRQVIQAKQHVPSRSCSPVSMEVCGLLGFIHLLPGCLHLTHQRPGAATWLTAGRVQERHRGGQALLFLWTSRWEHMAEEPGQEGVSILHTLNTSAEDSDMWRGAVIKSPNKVGRSRIRAGRGLRAQEGQTGRWQSLQVLLFVHLQSWNPGNATANPKWEHGEQTGQWRLGT